MDFRSHLITTTEQLEATFPDAPVPNAITKEIDHINASYKALIEAAPFFALATSGPEGLDCSPRGDPAGFVRVADPKTLLIPDRRGNNRIDSFRNIVRDPRVALMFMVPGCNEVIRVIARNKEATRNYQVKLALASNPKTAQATAMKFVNYLQDKDLQKLMKSKDVTTVISTHARRLLTRKGKL